VPPGRVPGLRRALPALRRVDPRVVLFDSWRGSFNDNPRAISEALHRRDPGFEHVWVLRPNGDPGPEWATAVAPESRRYLEQLGRCGFVVANGTMPGYFRKKAATTYVQTWHGTPLKRIAFDVPTGSAATPPKYLRNLRRDVDAWDLLLSPNRFSSDVFRRAFRYRGPVLESGYPRNDLLSSPERGDVRRRTRAALGIADGATAVLYAPTWRDDQSFALELDLGRVLDAVGEDHVVLLRAHQHVADTVDVDSHPGLRDVSRHTDNRELYLAADVLVSDYSSVIFDFAVTEKPILLFTYDLESYRDRLRGFYFDLEREAPGPLLRTTDDVISVLQDVDAVSDRYRQAYAEFRERFCSLEDGHAADRVVDAVFGG
jgi:CDP-glycerol glycerophosphotransferase